MTPSQLVTILVKIGFSSSKIVYKGLNSVDSTQ